MKKGIFSLNIPKRAFHTLALEERSDGATEIEHELVFYAKLSSKEFLSQLKFEDHEQWTYKFVTKTGLSVSNRVRKTSTADTTEFVNTVKTLNYAKDQTPMYNECSIIASADLFKLYKEISDSGMIKRRYFYPFTVNDNSYTFEIDVFLDDNGEPKDWVKVDLELPVEEKEDNNWVDYLPNDLTEVIEIRKATPEQKAQVSELYDTVFLTTK